MTRYGKDVESLLDQRLYKISRESVFSLGFKLINIIEQIHAAGFIYNDIKLDKVLLAYNDNFPEDCRQGNCFKDVTINLVDYDLASRYIDKKTGKHLPPNETGTFKGNMLFASANLLSFIKSSRRDDMISIFFLLVYLLNKGTIPGIPWRKTA